MIIKCEVCGKEIYIRPSHYKREKHHFCSRECFGIWERGENNPVWKNNNKKCLYCGKNFKPKKHSQQFCNMKCMVDYWKEKRISTCIICGKTFVRTLSQSGKFCSRKCADVFHSIETTGVKNPNWRGGLSKAPYPITFNKKLKKKIKKRDKHKCRLCGISEKEILKKGKGHGLAIHHIDYDKSNNQENNLISLCNKCHGFTHYGRDKWKKELSKMLEK